ncbi:MAG: ABC transporter transmembrane domain-containing protein [Rhizobiaceae bacterium]
MTNQNSEINNDQTGADQSKDRSGLKPLARLLPYVMRYKGHLIGALVFLALAAITTLSLPLAVRSLIDNGFSKADSALVNNYFYALFAIAALLALSSSMRYYCVIWLGERVVSDLRRDVFAHLTKLSAEFFDTAKTGELVSRLTADTTQIKSAAGATASMALRNVVLIIGAIAGMIYTSPGLSLIVLAAIPVIVLPIFAFGRNVRRKSRFAQDRLADATAYASESISSVRTLQAFTNEQMVANRFSDAVETSFAAARSSTAARAFLTAFAIFMIFSSVVGVLWIGAGAVLEGTMSPGLLGQFLLFSVMAAGALGALSEVWGELSQAAGAAERLSELLATKPRVAEPENPVALPDVSQGTLEFDDAFFAYPTRPDQNVVEGLSLKVKPGETVAVVGSSGAGKTTLFNLALRYYDPTSGTVRLDGVDISTASIASVRQRIALVPQDTTIFAMTVADNIRFGLPQASEEDVIKAAKLALAHDFVTQLKYGYETMLGERGITLSGGQRQRIAIARAILKNAPLLLLDEATSALDAESEKLVQKALDGLMVGRTTIVIAHRLATVLKADRILVMEGGKLVEEGSHEELVARKGIYARLAKLQFETEDAA